MPLYEYKCLDCLEKNTILIRKKDEEIICSKCGSKNIEKLITNFSITFKGKGFYKTDYKP